MYKVDRLFLEKDCINSSAIRSELDMDAVTHDGYLGKSGQNFMVFSAMSKEASADLLGRYDLSDNDMPVLTTHTGEVRTNLMNILNWLRAERFSLKR